MHIHELFCIKGKTRGKSKRYKQLLG
uniref:Uncharacterized protein n=1 Tax=Rhizophora mucronata TaxID=61149 RepID=A0A2P2PSN9_RHIMU